MPTIPADQIQATDKVTVRVTFDKRRKPHQAYIAQSSPQYFRIGTKDDGSPSYGCLLASASTLEKLKEACIDLLTGNRWILSAEELDFPAVAEDVGFVRGAR